MLAADADVIVLLDGDAADDPADLPRVLAPVLDGSADLVVGSRSLGTLEPGSMTPHQVFGNWLAATIMRRLYGVAVSDLGPFRAIRRTDLLGLDMQEMTYGWSVEMMVKAAQSRPPLPRGAGQLPAAGRRRLQGGRHAQRERPGRLVHPLDDVPLLALDRRPAAVAPRLHGCHPVSHHASGVTIS